MFLYDVMKKYADKKPARFHTPGHKGLLSDIDITELDLNGIGSTLDLIRSAEDFTAQYYGCKRCFYLISSTSSGILTLLASLPKGRVIMARASHKSLFNGCILSGIEPIIIDNDLDEDISRPLSPEQIENAVLANPDAVAAFITCPNYFGQTTDLVKIKHILDGRLLIVDAAHGAHYGAHEVLPVNPCRVADACVLSAHKTLPALTQAAYLMVNDDWLISSIDKHMHLITTTSPSFLLMASLEYATQYLIDNSFRYGELARLIDEKFPFRVKTQDITRLVIDLYKYNITGGEANHFLQDHDIFCEFASYRYIVFIISVVDTEENLDRLRAGIDKLFEFAGSYGEPQFKPETPKGARAVGFIDAARADSELIPLLDSEGRICAIEAGTFPPCLPIIVRGEIITKSIIDILSKNNVFGVEKGSILVLK